MTENQKKLKIAFKKQYNSEYLKQESYSKDYIYYKEDTLFKDNLESFYAELKYIDYERGRSALNTIWRCEKYKIDYVASMNLLDYAVKNNKINNSIICGNFQFYKQGTAILLESLELF